MRFLRSESYKRGVLLSIALNVVAKGLAFINSVVIAFFFGAQSKTDIYFYCYATMGLLVGFIGSLDNSVIIPEAMRIREQENADKAKYFLNYFLYLYLGAGVLIMILLLINPVGVLSGISNFDTDRLESNQDLIFWFIPICLLMLISQYLANILSSYKYFTIPIIAGIINNLFSLAFLISFHQALDVKSIIAGLVFGYFVNICILIFIMKRHLNWRFNLKKIKLPITLRKNIGYAFLGNITSLFSGYAPFFIMSNFNPGVVTMFNYARSLSDIPNQIVTNQFSAVSGIKFNEMSAQRKFTDLNKLFLDTTGALIFVMIPVCGILLLFSEQIITSFYQRGAFDMETVNQTAFILKFLSFSVVYFVINTMVSRLFMATQKLKESLWFQVYMNILFIIIIGLASYKFGINGYLAGTVLYQSIVIVFTYWLMKKYFNYIDYLKILKGIAIALFINSILVVGFGLLMKKGTVNLFLTGLCISLYFLFILFLNQIFQMDKVLKKYGDQVMSKLGTLFSLIFSGQRDNKV